MLSLSPSPPPRLIPPQKNSPQPPQPHFPTKESTRPTAGYQNPHLAIPPRVYYIKTTSCPTNPPKK
ncbi:MAG: hypothetical protein MJE68_26235 [Proteobacteria bacterium]|nr:hypothetical protein [Pseudomonadota bacterium]